MNVELNERKDMLMTTMIDEKGKNLSHLCKWMDMLASVLSLNSNVVMIILLSLSLIFILDLFKNKRRDMEKETKL